MNKPSANTSARTLRSGSSVNGSIVNGSSVNFSREILPLVRLSSTGAPVGTASSIDFPRANLATHRLSPAKISPISKSVARSLHGESGVALLELMLVIGVIAIGTAGIMGTYKVVDNNRKIGKEVKHARIIAKNVVTAGVTGFATGRSGDFMGLTQTTAKRYKLFPRTMLDDAGNPKNAWGGDVLLTATQVAGKPNWGAVLTFEQVPEGACSKLATQAAPAFYSVSVNDTNVRDSYGPLDVSALATACSDNSRIQFTYAKHGGAGEYVDPDNLAPCTVPPPTTEVITDLACPSGQLGDVSFRTDSVCYSPYGPSTDLPAVRISPDTCTPKCVLPSPATQNDIQTRPRTRTLACPAGQSSTEGGNMGITQTRQEQRESTRDASCPPSPGYSGPVGPYVWSAWTPFSSWLPTTPWSTVSNTCAPTCVAPAPTTETQPGTGTCTTGRVTPGGATTYSRSRTRSISYTCPGPTGAYTTVNGSWSAWSPAESAACAPKCVLPSPNPQTNPATRTNSQTFTCPSGQLISTPGPWQYKSSGTQTRSERRTQTRTASCPSPTSPVSWTPWSAWSTWTGTTPWTPALTCASACTVPSPWTQYTTGTPQTQTSQDSKAGPAESRAGTPATRTVALCPSNQYGTHAQTRPTTITRSTTQHREGTQTRTTKRARTVSYTCSSPTGTRTTHTTPYGAPGAPYGNWSAISWGAWGPPGAPNGPWSAPAVSGPWSSVSTTCKSCPAPLTQTQQNPANPILYNSYSCTSGYYGYYGRSYNQHRTRVRSYNCPAGTATLPSPDYTPYGAWVNGPISTTSNKCTKCPAPATETGKQWVGYTSYNCPSGKYGYNKREREQARTRTNSYSCPAGTKTLPPVSHGGWSGWSNTGATRDVSGTNCVSCPADKLVNQYRWVARTKACPNPYLNGQINYEQRQHRTYYQNWNCPAGTKTLPGAVNDRFTPYAWQTPTQNTVNNCSLPSCGSTLETQAKRYMAANQDLYNAYKGNWAGAKNHWNVYGHKENRPGSCWPKPAQNCVVAASTISRSWTGSRSCGPSYIPAGTYAHGAYATATYNRGNYKVGWTTGWAKYQCVNGVISSTPYQPSCYFEPAEPTCPGCVPW